MKFHRISGAVAFAVAGWLTVSSAEAACTLQATPIPVKMRDLRPLVTAKINGREGEFLLDSGSVIDTLNGRFAAQLKLKPQGVAETGTHLLVDASTSGQGAAGRDMINGLVRAEKFEFVGASFKDVPFMASDKLTDVDGLIGQPFLQIVDVEYDLSGGVVRLAKPQGCATTNLAYWVKPGESYSLAPLEKIDPDNPHTVTTVYINGVKLRAILDTGAPTSMITEAAAARAGVKTSDPGVVETDRALGLDGAFRSWVATFKSVKVGDEEIRNANMVVGASSSNWFDVLLGADFFLSHHIFVANSQGHLYFTYTGGPAFRTPSPAAPGASRK